MPGSPVGRPPSSGVVSSGGRRSGRVASRGGRQLNAVSVGRQKVPDLRSRSISAVILVGLLGPFRPLAALGNPFSVVAPKRMTICTSGSSWGGFDRVSWILVDEPVDTQDLRRIEITHSWSHPNIELRSE